MKVVELYYSVRELALLLRFSDKTIHRWVKAGRFSPPGEGGRPDLSNILDVGGDIRVPASGVNHFLASFSFVPPAGVKARTPGELRRKVQEAAHA